MNEAWHTIHRVVSPDRVPPGVEALYLSVDGTYEVLSRTAVRIDAQATLTSGTYFGAFPRVGWAPHVTLTRLRLAMTVEGCAEIRILATDAQGGRHTLRTEMLCGDGSFDLTLDERSAGWLWFEVETGESSATVRDARWCAPASGGTPVSVSVAITTFNRMDDCIALLARLGAEQDLLERITQVVVADQGSEKITLHPSFDEVRNVWGDRLRVVSQRNFGGSGGFSRGMIEALETTATHVLVLDDDVSLEPESVLRMVALAEHAEDDPLVGAQMLSLTDPTRIYSWGERVDRRRFWWGAVRPELSGIDVAQQSPARTPALSQSIAVDFNGWWMCLIPLTAIRRLGAALPLFIKWDDAEFGLRARQAGHVTRTLPGAALWHMPWTGKDDGLDWQSYYQLRNRLVTALIHSPYRRGGALVREVFALDMNHIICMQYGSASVRQLAVRDVLTGPSHLWPTLRNGQSRARAALAREGQELRASDSPDGSSASTSPAPPRGRWAGVRRFSRVVLHQLRKPRPLAADIAMSVRREDGKWWSLGVSDSAFLLSATGRGGFALRRDRRRAAALLLGAAASAFSLWLRWPALSRAYREAAPTLASREQWAQIFSEDA